MFMPSCLPVDVVRQTEARARRAAWIGNAVGAFVVFNIIGALIPILLDPDRQVDLALVNAPIAIAVILAASFFADWVNKRKFARATGWIRRGEEPTDEDIRHVLALPFWRAKRSEEHTSELQSRQYLVCRLLLE